MGAKECITANIRVRIRCPGRRLAIRLLLAVCTAGFAAEWVVLPALNPMRRSPESVAASLLGHTPPGSTRQEVQAWVDLQGWRHGGKPYPLNATPPIQRVVGEYHSFPFTEMVFAEWVFGEDDRLKSVEVTKWIADAP